MSDNEIEEVKNLVRASVVDIIRYDEVDKLIEKGLIRSQEDLPMLQELGRNILSHRCSRRCLRRVIPGDGPDSFVCRKPNNLHISPDNTKNCYVDLPLNLTSQCKATLIKIGLCEEPEISEVGYEYALNFVHDYFKPNRHVPPTNPSDDSNISPVLGELFAATKSMQNAQILTNTNGCNKYVCKYLGKIDENNYVIVFSNPHYKNSVRVKSTFMHNTKISSSKINEEKALKKKRYSWHPRGQIISLLEK